MSLTLELKNQAVNISPRRRAQLKASASKYDTAHRVERAQAARKRYMEHPAAVTTAVKKWVKANPLARLLQVARQRAKKRKIEFTITLADLIAVEFCPILLVRLVYSGKGWNPNAASIDRIDSTRGYISGNVAIISRRANIMKSNGTAAEHRAIAGWMEAQNGTR